MSKLARRVMYARDLSVSEIEGIFAVVDRLKQGLHTGQFISPDPKIVGCLFFEPSTRTRMSFQAAAQRLGHQVLTMELGPGSSLSKGETAIDTVKNVAAMGPDVLVIRSDDDPELELFMKTFDRPVINAGFGAVSHPTQGLLDAYTILRSGVVGKNVLIVGDILHSRVARSNLEILPRLGFEVAIAGPVAWLPEPSKFPGIRQFHRLDEAVDWADVYMGLRVQLERHDPEGIQYTSLSEYHADWGLNAERLRRLKRSAMILHPGPVNHGVEFSREVVSDSRSLVYTQVAHGVLVRAALLRLLLGS